MAKAFEVPKQTLIETSVNVIENVDGRHARRERGRLAVIDAMLILVSEGHVPPTVEQLAERAGVSAASVFRYFDTLEDLRQATTGVFFKRNPHLFEIPEIAKDPSRSGSKHSLPQAWCCSRRTNRWPGSSGSKLTR
jgi:Bacterial regulatory proteins, tetR family